MLLTPRAGKADNPVHRSTSDRGPVALDQVDPGDLSEEAAGSEPSVGWGFDATSTGFPAFGQIPRYFLSFRPCIGIAVCVMRTRRTGHARDYA